MTAPSKSWNTIIDGQVDADSPLDTTLMAALRDNLVHLEEWLGGGYTAAIDHSHNGTDSALITDLGSNVVGSDSLSYDVGDLLIISTDSLAQTSNTSYTKLKEIQIARSGTLRVKFRLDEGGQPISAEAKIYVNGSPVGTERQVLNDTGSQTFSEDISGLIAGDLVQIYGKRTGTVGTCDIDRFRLYVGTPIIEAVTLS